MIYYYDIVLIIPKYRIVFNILLLTVRVVRVS